MAAPVRIVAAIGLVFAVAIGLALLAFHRRVSRLEAEPIATDTPARPKSDNSALVGRVGELERSVDSLRDELERARSEHREPVQLPAITPPANPSTEFGTIPDPSAPSEEFRGAVLRVVADERERVADETFIKNARATAGYLADQFHLGADAKAGLVAARENFAREVNRMHAKYPNYPAAIDASRASWEEEWRVIDAAWDQALAVAFGNGSEDFVKAREQIDSLPSRWLE